MRKDHKKLHEENIKSKRWYCEYCGEYFCTRASMYDHKRELHKGMQSRKGKTEANCPAIAKAAKTYRERLASRQIVVKGHAHTEESKKKLSESMRRYYKEHPDKIPFRVWHYSKGESYPEKYFRKWLENEGIAFEQQYAFEAYNLDFLIGNIDLEIDGEQHFRTQKAKDRDLRRNQILEENGFKVIRVRWSHYQKLTQEEKSEFLQGLKESLLNAQALPDIYTIINNRITIPRYCKHCGELITTKNNKTYCSNECQIENLKLKNIPPKKQLIEDYKTLGTCEIAKKYNVPYQQIAKWRKRYKIQTPSRSWHHELNRRRKMNNKKTR